MNASPALRSRGKSAREIHLSAAVAPNPQQRDSTMMKILMLLLGTAFMLGLSSCASEPATTTTTTTRETTVAQPTAVQQTTTTRSSGGY